MSETTLSVLDPLLREMLPAKARADLEYWENALASLQIAHGQTYETLARVATALGQPVKTVRNRYYAFKRHGIFGLIDRRLCGPKFWAGYRARQETCASLCPGLIALFRQLCGRNQRNSKNAWLELVELWKDRDAQIAEIAQYADFPGWPELPRGWSYENLMRHAPSKFETVAARQGRFAATAHRSTVLTTRAGLWVGSHILFDDKWHDCFVNTFAENQAGRPLEVYALDLYPAYKRSWGVRVRTKDQEGNYQGIAEHMTRMILAATLFNHGYSPRGTVLVTEHGTARIKASVAAKLHEISGGLITISESGMLGDASHSGQYAGKQRGNPNHKAALESNNNLEHNRLQSIPGQTGRNLDNRPEELDGRLDYNGELLAARATLPPEIAALLDFPILELSQYTERMVKVYAAIADSRDHDLEGWIECGHIVQEYAWGTTPVLETSLTPEQRAQIPALLSTGLLTARPVRMTRREVWERGAGELIRLPGAGVCAILGDDLAREVRCTRGEFAIEDKEIGPGVFRFEQEITDHEGRALMLREGEKYQAFINPFAPNTLFLRDAAGRYLGQSRRIIAASRADLEGLQRAIGEAASREGKLLEPLRRDHAAAARERLKRHRRNAALLDTTPAAPRIANPESPRGQRNQQLAAHLAAQAEQQFSQ